MRIYLDNNATHPLLPAVRAEMATLLGPSGEEDVLMNPSSIHRAGQGAKKFVAELRATLGAFLGRGDGDEFVFLSGATEALNLAIRAFAKSQANPRLMCSQVEHSAVLDTVADCDPQAAMLTVDAQGQLNESELYQKIENELAQGKNILLALQLVNNETGLSFAFDKILPELYRRFGPSQSLSLSQTKKMQRAGTLREQRLWILVDAAQALGKMPEEKIRRVLHYADYMAFSGHKLGAPAGFGALWLRPGAPFKSQMTGGTQEKKRRAGTFNSLGAYGFLAALKDWQIKGAEYRDRIGEMKAWLKTELAKISGLQFHGESELCNTLNFHVEGCPEESLLLALDLEGICVSSGSACHSGSLRASHVLTAMGYDSETAYSSLRVCLGVQNTWAELKQFVEVLSAKVSQVRRAREKARDLLPEIR